MRFADGGHDEELLSVYPSTKLFSLAPSLVSFVSQTGRRTTTATICMFNLPQAQGAGKSGLVKLLISVSISALYLDKVLDCAGNMSSSMIALRLAVQCQSWALRTRAIARHQVMSTYIKIRGRLQQHRRYCTPIAKAIKAESPNLSVMSF